MPRVVLELGEFFLAVFPRASSCDINCIESFDHERLKWKYKFFHSKINLQCKYQTESHSQSRSIFSPDITQYFHPIQNKLIKTIVWHQAGMKNEEFCYMMMLCLFLGLYYTLTDQGGRFDFGWWVFLNQNIVQSSTLKIRSQTLT